MATPGDRYKLGRELGRGGLGRVVEAEDTAVGRTVALKLLLDGAPLDLVQRFKGEGRLTGRLEHPGIVPVHDVGTQGGSLFYAMKRVSGRDMGEVLKDVRAGKGGEWTLRRLMEAYRSVCLAVAFAHSRGVIHRDLKPSNVMLGDFGEVLIVDWGLAKERDAVPIPASNLRTSKPPNLTLSGDVMGTPEYMAPEQAAGDVDQVDALSDVWSLGAILYEILTGRPPFTGKSADEVLSRVLSEMPDKPASIVLRREVAPVPPELEAACMKALQREKEKRFQSAADLAAEVTAWLEGTRERERRAAAAEELVAHARERLAAWEAKTAEAEALHRTALDRQRARKPWEPLEDRREVLEALDGAEAAEREAARAAADAGAALASALSNVAEHVEARNLLAGMYWKRFLAAEREGNLAEMTHNRQFAERYNAGALDGALRGWARSRCGRARTGAAACGTGARFRPGSCVCWGITRGRGGAGTERRARTARSWSPSRYRSCAFTPLRAARRRSRGLACGRGGTSRSGGSSFRCRPRPAGSRRPRHCSTPSSARRRSGRAAPACSSDARRSATGRWPRAPGCC